MMQSEGHTFTHIQLELVKGLALGWLITQKTSRSTVRAMLQGNTATKPVHWAYCFKPDGTPYSKKIERSGEVFLFIERISNAVQKMTCRLLTQWIVKKLAIAIWLCNT